MKTDEKEVFQLMSKRLASRDVSDADMNSIAEFVLGSGHKIVGLDPCIRGYCVDLQLSDGLANLNLGEIVSKLPGRLRDIDIRERGIFPDDPYFAVSVTHEI